ncbi:MAG: hypothetical protein HYZ11_16450 [Candidatus Tectomicrobia bacterium]|uniref:Extracellular solute-binding protein n=1 Tax=Tectimicrobiota bacterium TaxID=2528274 RepID=A0A932I4U7_UNCTE|nr:hypothetical protein [Candidatus Tectomicrobia bacterium]
MQVRLRLFALRTCASVATLAVLALSGSPAGAQVMPHEEKLIREAKKEGSVTIINPILADSTERVFGPAFIKYYNLGDGFKFNNLRKGTGPVVAQVRQEIQAKRFTVDAMFVNSPAFFDAAAKQGVFLKLESGRWKDHEEGMKKAGQYFKLPYVVTPFAYTFVPVWNSGCPGMENFQPKSIFDTVAPALKGKTIASDLTRSLTYTNTTIGLKETGVDMDKFFKMLKATNPVIEFRTEPKMQMVLTCERPIDTWNLAARVPQAIAGKPELKDKIKLGTYSEGHVMLGNQMAAFEGASHPNAAKLLIEFFLTKESADLMAKHEGMYSFMKGWTIPKDIWFMKEVKAIGLKDWLKAGAQHKTVRGEWQKMFR